MRRWVSWGGLFVIMLLAACDQQRIAELEEGVATEADVTARFGVPHSVYSEDGGARTLEYSRQPEGQVNYMITIGADGRMSALRQVLRADVFAKVQPGMDKAQLRRLLGRPARTLALELKQQEVWDWRYAENQQDKLFSVTLDAQGLVVSSASTADPGTALPGGK